MLVMPQPAHGVHCMQREAPRGAGAAQQLPGAAQQYAAPAAASQGSGSEEEEQEEQPLPPLEPLKPQLRLPAPQLVEAQYVCAAVTWPVQEVIALPQAQDDRQAAFQLQLQYKVMYDLELQLVSIGPPTDAITPEALLARVPAACGAGAWKSVKTLEERPSEPVMIPGLRAGRFYAARLTAKAYAVVEGDEQQPWFFEDDWASQVLAFRTVPCPPGQMQAPSLAQRQRNALKLKWSTPDETGGEHISCYELKVRPPPPSWEGLVQDEEDFAVIYQGTNSSFLLNKLGPAQRFSFKIRCFNRLGCGQWSLPSTFTTQASVPAPPEPPRRVASTKDSLTLQWDAPHSNGAAVNFYELEADDGQGGDFGRAYTGADTQAVVPKLQSGLTYRFRLKAQNSEGWSLWSAVLEASTTAAVPTAPQDVEFRRVTPTAVALSWTPPLKDGGSAITMYQVELLAKSKLAAAALGDGWTIIFQGLQQIASFEALQAGCDYQVRVCAVNQQGLGEYSHPKWLKAGCSTPMAPDTPIANFAQARALFIDWKPPEHDGGAAIQRYRIDCRQLDGAGAPAAAAAAPRGAGADGWWHAYNGPHTGNPAAVPDLQPGTTYQFRVAAINEHGMGEFSPCGTATTHAAEPLQPGPPQLLGAASTSIKLAWREPHGQGAPVTKYRVGLACLGSTSGSAVVSREALALARSGSASSLAHSRSSSASGLALANGQHAAGEDAQQQGGEHSDDAASSCSATGGVAQQPAAPKLRWEVVYNGGASQAELKQLRPAHRYLVQVRAFNCVGGSPWSEVIEVTTAPAAPGAPASLAAEGSSSSSITVSWQPPAEDNGAPVGTYFLEMAAGNVASSSSGGAAALAAAATHWVKVWSGAGSAGEGASGSGSFSHRVGGLLPGRKYSWRLRAANACGLGPWCEPAGAATLPAKPCAPPKPSVGKVTASSVMARWSIPSEDNGSTVSEYELQLREVQQQQPEWRTVYQGSELSHKVADLRAGCQYELRVAAKNRMGRGPFSEAVAWTTALMPPPAPCGVSAQLQPAAAAHQRQHGADVSWRPAPAPPNSAETAGYEVEAAPAGAGASSSGSHTAAAASSAAAGSAAVKAQVAGQATSASLAGLLPGRTYVVRVRAVGKGGAGHSPWSEAVSVTTPEAPAAAGAAGKLDAEATARDATGKRHGKGKGGKGGPSGHAQQEAQPTEQRRGGRAKAGTPATRAVANPRQAKKTLWQQYAPRELRQLSPYLPWLLVGVMMVCFFWWAWSTSSDVAAEVKQRMMMMRAAQQQASMGPAPAPQGAGSAQVQGAMGPETAAEFEAALAAARALGGRP